MLNERGHEVPDPTPMAVPIGFKPPPTMVELIRMHIRREMSAVAQNQGAETFEESEDFDVEDDPVDPHTPFEAVFDPPPPDLPSQAAAAASPAPAAGSSSSTPPSSPEASSPNPP